VGSEPLVAIGMPVYNGARHVEEAVRSLLAQTERDLVVLISDDASTDETPEICARLAEEDGRVRLQRQPANLGMTGNFLHVLHEASGEFFMWAAQDDRWDPEFLSEGLTLLRADPEAIGYMPAVSFEDADGVHLGTAIPPGGLASEDPFRRARSVVRDGYHALYALYRRSVLLDDVELQDIFGTDCALVFGLALRGRFVLSRYVRSLRRDIGHEFVLGPRGRLVVAKALGGSGHLYSGNPNAMCASMIREGAASRIGAVEKARLALHVAGAWWLPWWRALMLNDSKFRMERAMSAGRYAAAAGLLVRHVLLSPGSILKILRRPFARPRRVEANQDGPDRRAAG
jgi:glycosyltransferase involved in cell wall biosynthesis